MIKRKFVFTMSFILMLVTLFIWHSGILSGLESLMGVQQVVKQDDYLMASIIREAVISGKLTFYNTLGFMASIAGIGYSFVPKKIKIKKDDEKNA